MRDRQCSKSSTLSESFMYMSRRTPLLEKNGAIVFSSSGYSIWLTFILSSLSTSSAHKSGSRITAWNIPSSVKVSSSTGFRWYKCFFMTIKSPLLIYMQRKFILRHKCAVFFYRKGLFTFSIVAHTLPLCLLSTGKDCTC